MLGVARLDGMAIEAVITDHGSMTDIEGPSKEESRTRDVGGRAAMSQSNSRFCVAVYLLVGKWVQLSLLSWDEQNGFTCFSS